MVTTLDENEKVYLMIDLEPGFVLTLCSYTVMSTVNERHHTGQKTPVHYSCLLM